MEKHDVKRKDGANNQWKRKTRRVTPQRMKGGRDIPTNEMAQKEEPLSEEGKPDRLGKTSRTREREPGHGKGQDAEEVAN